MSMTDIWKVVCFLFLLFVTNVSPGQNRPPTMPNEYYTEISATRTFYDQDYNGAPVVNTYQGIFAYDGPNGKMCQKNMDMEYLENYSITLALPGTSIIYYMDNGDEYCDVRCCGGVEEVSSGTTDSTMSTWDVPDTWYSDEEVEDTLNYEFMVETALPSETLVTKIFKMLEKGGSVAFHSETSCSGGEVVDLFAVLSRCRSLGFCSHQGLNGNLWGYYGYGYQTEFFCIQTDGTPLYIEFENYDSSFYLYFDVFEREAPNAIFQIPDGCDCVID